MVDVVKTVSFKTKLVSVSKRQGVSLERICVKCWALHLERTASQLFYSLCIFPVEIRSDIMYIAKHTNIRSTVVGHFFPNLGLTVCEIINLSLAQTHTLPSFSRPLPRGAIIWSCHIVTSVCVSLFTCSLLFYTVIHVGYLFSL